MLPRCPFPSELAAERERAFELTLTQADLETRLDTRTRQLEALNDSIAEVVDHDLRQTRASIAAARAAEARLAVEVDRSTRRVADLELRQARSTANLEARLGDHEARLVLLCCLFWVFFFFFFFFFGYPQHRETRC